MKKLKTLRLDSNNILKLETSDLVGCVQLTVLDLSSNMLDNLAVSIKLIFGIKISHINEIGRTSIHNYSRYHHEIWQVV